MDEVTFYQLQAMKQLSAAGAADEPAVEGAEVDDGEELDPILKQAKQIEKRVCARCREVPHSCLCGQLKTTMHNKPRSAQTIRC
eukprot:SAG31_NODE_2376_length_5841_cov_10.199060_4_plen_84_part_00